MDLPADCEGPEHYTNQAAKNVSRDKDGKIKFGQNI